ncbi:MAG: hypothetical protein M3O46_10520 [Myxococcota bacterium]|nr:hypothetical protein [Myxococcota bacterium]
MRSIPLRALLQVGALLMTTAICSPALADSVRIALVRPPVSSAAIAEALTRIQGELTADGFEVVLVDAPGALDAASTGADKQDVGAIASLGVFVDTGAHVAVLRVIDRLTNKIVVRKTAIQAPETSRLAEVLAVRAVELLRASLLELLMESRPPPESGTPPPAEARKATQWAAHALSQTRPSMWAVEAGTALLLGFGGVGPALLGVIRICAAVVGPLSARATVAGLGTEPRVDAPPGSVSGASATVGQQLGFAELVVGPWADAPVHPIVSVGAGALHATVTGQPGSGPFVGLTSARWSFAADAGAGVQVRLSPRFDLDFETHAFVAQPYPVVRFLDAAVTVGGRPSILGSLTVVGRL